MAYTPPVAGVDTFVAFDGTTQSIDEVVFDPIRGSTGEVERQFTIFSFQYLRRKGKRFAIQHDDINNVWKEIK